MAKEGGYMTVAAEEMEELRRRSRELEREVEEMKTAMLELWRRTVMTEEAEERLCSQLAELEVESLDQARDYHDRVVFLMDQISRLSSLSIVSSTPPKTMVRGARRVRFPYPAVKAVEHQAPNGNSGLDEQSIIVFGSFFWFSVRFRLKNQVLALAGNDNQRDPKKELIKVADDWDDVGIIPISELHETSELENVKIVCSVEAVDTDWAWYYFGCKSCGKIVTRIRRSVSGKLAKPLFRCPGCRTNGSNVLPKFKLHLIVRDDTGDCKLVLLGSIAKTLIGLEAHEIWDGSYEEVSLYPENLPQPILDLVDKSFCFGLCPSDSGSEIYKVSKVWSGDIIHQIETESEPVTLIEGCSSTVSSGGVMLQDVDTHASSEDCATPFSKRKETDSELPDITSTSKKLCTPTIKTEKSKID
ncbi:unnamed protein product [Brassica rapa subsp. narinosa]